MAEAKSRRFLSPHERQQRIEAVMKRKGWTWYHLAKLMRRPQPNVQKTFKDVPDPKRNPSLGMLKDLAVALNVSVGFLVDREVKR